MPNGIKLLLRSIKWMVSIKRKWLAPVKIFSQSLAIFSIIGVDYILCVAILSIFFCRKAFSFFIFQLIAVVKIKFSGTNFLVIVINFLESPKHQRCVFVEGIALGPLQVRFSFASNPFLLPFLIGEKWDLHGSH